MSTGHCEHCGQPLPGYGEVATYGERRPSKTGIAVTLGVHLLLVLAYLLQPEDKVKPGGAAEEAVMIMVPTPSRARPREQAPRRREQALPELPRVEMPRLPDTITPPEEKPVERAERVQPVPEEMDMAAYIEARRRARGVREEPAAESEDARAMRNIQANVARANAAARDDGSGGIFSITDVTFNSAVLKFRGWNPNFKRRWLQQVTVEVGGERDLETAIVRKMIEIIRNEKKGDFQWESHRLGRTVTLSARPEDTEALQAFLYKEMFPNYRAPGG